MSADPVPRDDTGAPRRLWVSSALTAFALAVLSALAVPLMGLPDEPAHAVHAVAVVRGELVGQDTVRTDPTVGWTRTETSVRVPAAYAGLPALPVCFAFRPDVPAACAPPVAEAAGRPTAAVTTVGTYNPAWYAAVGWPTLLVPPLPALVAARLVAASLFAALVAVAVIGAWRAGARRWGLAGLLLALPPVAVHLAGGINPSGTEIAAAAALWTTSAAMVGGATARPDVARWVVAGVAVAVARPLGPALAIGIPVATFLVLRDRTARSPWARRRVRVGAAAVGATAMVALGWSLWRGTLSAFSGFPTPEATGLTAVRRSLGLVPERLAEMVGVLGWADVALPRAVVAGWLVAVVVLLAAGLRRADRAPRAWLLALAVAVLALPVAADVRSAPTIGFVWQGRYTLPVATGLPILAGLLVDRFGPGRGPGRWLLPLVVAGAGAAHAAGFLAVLRRFRVGRDGSLVAGLTQPGGPTDVAGWVLMSAVAVVIVFGVVMATRLVWLGGEAVGQR